MGSLCQVWTMLPQRSNSVVCPQISKFAITHTGTRWGRKTRRQAKSLLNHGRLLTHRCLVVPRGGEARKREWEERSWVRGPGAESLSSSEHQALMPYSVHWGHLLRLLCRYALLHKKLDVDWIKQWMFSSLANQGAAHWAQEESR